jgi:CDP-glucose 4,6-dehydratase
MDYPLGQRLRELPGPLLLTGHTGFKGTWMTFLLEHLKVPVVGYSLAPENDSLYERAARTGAIPEATADIREYVALERFIDLHKPSTIIHMAAQSLVLNSYETPRETFDVNVMGTVNVLDIAFKKDFVKAIIIVTTDKVYRNNNSGQVFVETDPLEGKDPYSASKVGAEAVAAAWQQIAKVSGGPKVVSVRAGNVIGGGDFAQNRLMPDIVRNIFFGGELVIRNPDSTRPWQHVLDPLSGYLMALDAILSDTKINNLNFSHNENQNLSVRDVVKVATRFSQIDGLKNLDVEQKSENDKSKEAVNLSLNSNLALKTLGWLPTWSQVRAVEETLNWWQEVAVEGLDSELACERAIIRFLESNQKITGIIL